MRADISEPAGRHVGRYFIIIGSLALFILMAGATAGANWTVDDNWAGADHSSIQDAIDGASIGDTILVHAGTYSEELVVSVKLDIIGNGTLETTISGDGLDHAVEIVSPQVNLMGLTISGTGSGTKSGIYVNNQDDINISDCLLNGHGGHGIHADNVGRMWINSSVISFNGGTGLFLDDVDGSTLESCWISENAGYGINWGGEDNVIESCIINNGSGGLMDAGILVGGARFEIGNVSIEGGSYGIKINDLTDDCVISNATISDNEVGVYIGKDSSSNRFSECIIRNSTFEGVNITDNANSQIDTSSIYDNARQGIIATETSDAKVFDCEIFSNGGYGIEVVDGIGNEISRNNLVDNGRFPQGFDDSTNNFWYDAGVGNYWSEYNGTDYDDDDIGDDHHYLDGAANAKDWAPKMVMSVTGAPIKAPTRLNLTVDGLNHSADGHLFITPSTNVTLIITDTEGYIDYRVFSNGTWSSLDVYDLPFNISTEGIAYVEFTAQPGGRTSDLHNRTLTVDGSAPAVEEIGWTETSPYLHAHDDDSLYHSRLMEETENGTVSGEVSDVSGIARVEFSYEKDLDGSPEDLFLGTLVTDLEFNGTYGFDDKAPETGNITVTIHDKLGHNTSVQLNHSRDTSAPGVSVLLWNESSDHLIVINGTLFFGGSMDTTHSGYLRCVASDAVGIDEAVFQSKSKYNIAGPLVSDVDINDTSMMWEAKYTFRSVSEEGDGSIQVNITDMVGNELIVTAGYRLDDTSPSSSLDDLVTTDPITSDAALIDNATLAWSIWINGSARDNLTGIRSVEHRIDGGNWVAANLTFDGHDFRANWSGTNSTLNVSGWHLLEWRVIDRVNNAETFNMSLYRADDTYDVNRTTIWTMEGNGTIPLAQTVEPPYKLRADVGIDRPISLLITAYRPNDGPPGDVPYNGMRTGNPVKWLRFVEIVPSDPATLETLDLRIYYLDSDLDKAGIVEEDVVAISRWSGTEWIRMNSTVKETNHFVKDKWMEGYAGSNLTEAGLFSLESELYSGDEAPPDTDIILGLPRYFGDTTYITENTELFLNSTDLLSGVDTVEYRAWYGTWGAWSDFTANFTLSGAGTHYVEFRATDLKGNVEDAENETFVVDIAPPITVINTSGYLEAGQVKISTFFSFDPVDTDSGVLDVIYRYKEGGVWSTWSSYTDPFNLTDPGPVIIEFYAIDNLGNVEGQLNASYTLLEPEDNKPQNGGGGDDDGFPIVYLIIPIVIGIVLGLLFVRSKRAYDPAWDEPWTPEDAGWEGAQKPKKKVKRARTEGLDYIQPSEKETMFQPEDDADSFAPKKKKAMVKKKAVKGAASPKFDDMKAVKPKGAKKVKKPAEPQKKVAPEPKSEKKPPKKKRSAPKEEKKAPVEKKADDILAELDDIDLSDLDDIDLDDI